VKDRVTLQDEDLSTKNGRPLRRLNTLSLYRLPDGATVSLIPRQRSLYSVNSSTSNNKSSSVSKYGNWRVAFSIIMLVGSTLCVDINRLP